MDTLILIANSELALWVSLEKSHFQVIQQQEHPQSKEKVGHLVSDRPGRTFSRTSKVRHALNEGQNVLKLERRKFARKLVRTCGQMHTQHHFQQLWVVSGPQFLGELRPLFGNIPSLPFSIREIQREVPPHESIEEKMGKIYEWVAGNAPRKGSLWKTNNIKQGF